MFYLPGAASFYFTNIAFFVALPTVVTLAARRIHQGNVAKAHPWALRPANRRWVKDTRLLLLGLAVIVVLGLKGYYRASALSSAQSPPHRSAFIESLLRVRDELPINIALKPDPSRLWDNPVARCSAQPLVFPAVSERPWIDVIPEREDCYYLYYGYAQYGITDTRQSVTVKPRRLPGMTIRHWPLGPQDKPVDSNPRAVQE